MAGILETTELCRSYYCSHFTEEETGSEVTLADFKYPSDASSCTVNDYHYCPCTGHLQRRLPGDGQQPFSASEPQGLAERALGDGPVLGKVHVEAGPACSPQGSEILALGSLGLSNLPSSTPSPPPVPAPEEISLRPQLLQGMALLLQIHVATSSSSPPLPPGVAALLLQTQSGRNLILNRNVRWRQGRVV